MAHKNEKKKTRLPTPTHGKTRPSCMRSAASTFLAASPGTGKRLVPTPNCFIGWVRGRHVICARTGAQKVRHDPAFPIYYCSNCCDDGTMQPPKRFTPASCCPYLPATTPIKQHGRVGVCDVGGLIEKTKQRRARLYLKASG